MEEAKPPLAVIYSVNHLHFFNSFGIRKSSRFLPPSLLVILLKINSRVKGFGGRGECAI
jgi:hypothetical protein